MRRRRRRYQPTNDTILELHKMQIKGNYTTATELLVTDILSSIKSKGIRQQEDAV